MLTNKREVLKGFFVLEGIDGSGTTTQLHRLEARAVTEGVAFRADCEPTSHPAGVLIRTILRGDIEAQPGTIARLFAADRHQHLEGPLGIRRSLNAGTKVLSDRYFFSSLAYQGLDCSWEEVSDLNVGFPFPETLFFLDLEVGEAQARINSRGQAREIYEEAPIQERVRLGYQRAISEAQAQGLEVMRLDARQSVKELTDSIWSRICR